MTFQNAKRKFHRIDRHLDEIAGLLESCHLTDEAEALDKGADAIEQVRERLEDLRDGSRRLFGTGKSRREVRADA